MRCASPDYGRDTYTRRGQRAPDCRYKDLQSLVRAQRCCNVGRQCRRSRRDGTIARQIDPKPIRVLLVDDHVLLTDALSQILGREADMHVVGVAATVAEAKALARERLDVVLMD